MTRAYLQVLLDFHYWARDRMLAAVAALTPQQYEQPMGNSFSSVRDTVNHIYQAEWIWFSRWNGVSPTSFGDPTFGYGVAPVWATRSYQPWPPLRSRSSVTRAFVLSKAGASHLRWSRPSPFSRTYSFRTIPTGKAYARRGGRRR